MCGERFQVDLETAAALKRLEVEECAVCSPSLHRRHG
jgi:hypothetical protein